VWLRTRAAAVFGERLSWQDIFAGDATWEPSLDVAFIGTDLSGTVRLWNRTAERLYGWPAAEVVGRPITEITVGPDDGAVAERIMASIRSTGAWEGEFWVARRDGARFLAYVCDRTVAGADGRPLGIVGLSIELAPERGDPRRSYERRRG
jgi:PAS domain S-box-containing protein